MYDIVRKLCHYYMPIYLLHCPCDSSSSDKRPPFSLLHYLQKLLFFFVVLLWYFMEVEVHNTTNLSNTLDAVFLFFFCLLLLPLPNDLPPSLKT